MVVESEAGVGVAARAERRCAADMRQAGEGSFAPLRAVVLLAGGVRPAPLAQAADRFLLDLPVSDRATLADEWRDQLLALAKVSGDPRRQPLAVRMMMDRHGPLARVSGWPDPLTLSVEHDPFELRGMGGLLSDLAQEYTADDWLLVLDGLQLLVEPLPALVERLWATPGDVRLLAAGGRPAGVMLVRCGALRSLPRLGFVDLKEQALPRIAAEHQVRVCASDRPVGYAVRVMEQYLAALRQYHGRSRSARSHEEIGEEPWRSAFSVIEAGSDVDATAVVHDSVVLGGGRMERGSVAVRSLICPGGAVGQATMAIDRQVSPKYSPRRHRGTENDKVRG